MDGTPPASDNLASVPDCNSKGRNPSPIDGMPATVTLYVYGLGVWYLVNGAQRGLMRFLREEDHELSIVVLEKDASGTVIRTQKYVVPMTEDQIFIAGDKPARTTIELNERMPFERYEWEWNDPEDLRWLVDMTNDVHGGVKVGPIPNDKTLTPMTVYNALFYTKNYSDRNMEVVNAAGTVIDKTFGAVGCIIGAKIEAAAVRIILKGVIDETLTKVPGVSHEIHVFNQGADVKSDFYKYYWILGERSPMPRTFDLVPASQGTMSGEVVCASVRGDGDGHGGGD